MGDTIRGAVIGYGAAFNMGRAHASMMQETEGIACVAVCDLDEARTDAAKEDFPDIKTYNKVESLLADETVNLIANVLPHNLHCSITLECIRAGKHVVVEKPMCITIAEATEMINTAKGNGLMLSVHHNRRWDPDFWTLRNLVRRGAIGQVFSVEMWSAGYGSPDPNWWRSVKAISGGNFYDWGAHYVDWLLHIIEEKMVNVSGFFQPNLVWKDITNEDHVQAIIRFANDTVANVQMSHIAKIEEPRWKLFGSHGSIVSEANHFKVISEMEGGTEEQIVEYERRPGPDYYQNIVGHLNTEEPLIITAESARRVIAVLELAEKSSKTHQAETVPYEFE